MLSPTKTKICFQMQATNNELDKSVQDTMEITRIALNNDWSTAKNAKILQRHEAGKSLEDRAIKMTEDEKRKKEKAETTPAKQRRVGESVSFATAAKIIIIIVILLTIIIKQDPFFL
jgi:hypothetical protein